MPKLQDIVQAELPFRDKPVNVLKLGDWWGLVLGIAVLAIATSIALPLTRTLRDRLEDLPLLGRHVAEPEPPAVQRPRLRILQ